MRRCAFALLLAGCAGASMPGAEAVHDSGARLPGDGGVDACDFTGLRGCGSGEACSLMRLDDGGVARRCVAGACDLIDSQCATGLKCGFVDGVRACIAAGMLREGDTCQGAATTCKKGLACIVHGASSSCTRYCRLDRDCAAPEICYQTLTLAGTRELPMICSRPADDCDALRQNCANASEGCFPGANGTGCYPSGGIGIGLPCAHSNACVKGAACSANTGPYLCHEMCAYPSGSPGCDGGMVCGRLGSSTSVGVCL